MPSAAFTSTNYQHRSYIMGNHKVRQDKDYVSRVTQADFWAFQAIPDMTHAKFVAAVHPRKGTDGKGVTIAADMVLAPARYGFADRAAAQKWLNAVELAK